MKSTKKLRKAAFLKQKTRQNLDYIRQYIKYLPVSSYNAARKGQILTEELYYLIFELKAEGYKIKHEPSFYPLTFAEELKEICRQ